jgi:hypothetical protein
MNLKKIVHKFGYEVLLISHSKLENDKILFQIIEEEIAPLHSNRMLDTTFVPFPSLARRLVIS